MSTHNKYLARLGPVLEPRYRIGQRTLVNSRAIHQGHVPWVQVQCEPSCSYR